MHERRRGTRDRAFVEPLNCLALTEGTEDTEDCHGSSSVSSVTSVRDFC
jgi:hypothetical protein